MIDITLVGACGRMGAMITAAIADSKRDTRISGAVEFSGHPDLGRDIGEVAGLKTAGVAVTDKTVRSRRRYWRGYRLRPCPTQLSAAPNSAWRKRFRW